MCPASLRTEVNVVRMFLWHRSGLIKVLICHVVGVFLQANVRDHTLRIEKLWLAFCHLLPTVKFFMGL